MPLSFIAPLSNPRLLNWYLYCFPRDLLFCPEDGSSFATCLSNYVALYSKTVLVWDLLTSCETKMSAIPRLSCSVNNKVPRQSESPNLKQRGYAMCFLVSAITRPSKVLQMNGAMVE